MKSVKELAPQANSRADTVTAQEAVPLLTDPDSVFVDLRDNSELIRDGKIPGAVHITRGTLEFALDPTVPYHNPVFSSGKNVVFNCATVAARRYLPTQRRAWDSRLSQKEEGNHP